MLGIVLEWVYPPESVLRFRIGKDGHYVEVVSPRISQNEKIAMPQNCFKEFSAGSASALAS